MTPEQFAKEEHKDLTIYQALAQNETNPEFRSILQRLVETEREHFEFWKKFSPKKEFHVSALHIAAFKLMRQVLGLTFVARYLERGEKKTIEAYHAFLKTVDDSAVRIRIQEIIENEKHHEQELISEVKEERVEFISSIILGLNDGLIELTGALIGFSFAFGQNKLVALAGTITGVSAALSMASSAYMQARHEQGKDPKKSGLYTGVSYIIVVALLVMPFILFKLNATSILVMAVIILVILCSISFYSSVLFGRKFLVQFGEMFIFSVGVAFVSFLIGSFFKSFTGIGLQG